MSVLDPLRAGPSPTIANLGSTDSLHELSVHLGDVYRHPSPRIELAHSA